MTTLEVQLTDKEQPQFVEEESKNTGAWDYHQNLLYIVFLEINKSIMVSKKKIKTYKIFDRMAQFVGTRDTFQCRSHHQKITEKFIDVKHILKYFKRKINPDDFHRQYALRTGKKQRKTKKEPQLKDQDLIIKINIEESDDEKMKSQNSNEKTNDFDLKLPMIPIQKTVVSKQIKVNTVSGIQHQMRQFKFLRMQFQYLQYCFDKEINPQMMPFDVFCLFHKPEAIFL